MTYCDDCPDREACHQGMSCELSRRFAVAAELYRQKMRGNTMSKNSPAKATAESLVEQAVEENLVVPAQAEGEPKVEKAAEETGDATAEAPELKVIEGGKKSLKERLAEVTGHLKKNQKALIAVGAAASVAALAFAKYAKKKAEEALELEQVEPEPFEVTETVDTPADESAA